MIFMKNDKDKEIVGDIRIKQTKSKKKKNGDNTSIGVKIFVWFMFLAMLASFLTPLIYYLVSVISAS